jgi:DNA polymerase V
MSCLEELAPRVEQYSIDEMFLDLTGVEHCMDLEDFAGSCASTCMTVPV